VLSANEMAFLKSQGSFKGKPGDRAMQPLREAARIDVELARLGIKVTDEAR
jgi:hypothetical protein